MRPPGRSSMEVLCFIVVAGGLVTAAAFLCSLFVIFKEGSTNG